MPQSYVEDITAAWLRATGHLVFRNVWLRTTGTRRSWTDIDILAAKDRGVSICSCKAFLGTGGVQDMNSQSFVLPSGRSAVMHLWEPDRDRLVVLDGLSWEYVEARVLPRLHLPRAPADLDEFRRMFRQRLRD